ncbi:TetR/AcrR family transcriptional regulator [Herpetosiphon giganteus]|uniref:TetR/AcrR family transcriptional regulator n=1 Tax=Herpetosiphon giganteus TaxID=2029754 RepID=UPI001958418C|nr:TetR/AcrR family transcriptional regulator [Herpetosiphon giganteus]MBM7845340.1 AcrR family transcriptional regulator [Herpetosiphon giganteus]
MQVTRPRGRPRTFDRQAALEAAMELFWRHGYEGTSIADLTTAMGFTPPTLYAAFGSKEDLYREVIQFFLLRSERRRMEAALEQSSAYAMLRSYLYAAAENFTDPHTPAGCMVATAALQCATENQPIAQEVARIRQQMLLAFVERLNEAKTSGELPTTIDALALANFYTAIVQGMSVQAIDGANTNDLIAVVDLALSAWPGEKSEGKSQKSEA